MDTVLIVDDELYIREELAEIIQGDQRVILFAGNGVEGLHQLENHTVDLVLTDIRMPEMDGFEFIRRAHQKWPNIPIITITAFASTETAVEALRTGAYDYVTKPFSVDDIRNMVDHALQAQHLFKEVNYLRGRLAERYSLDNIIGQCSQMQRVFEATHRVASASCNILITGESGTGKDMVAQSIHEHSLRTGKFVPINCGSIPEGLLESELFGHVKGSFTGAVNEKEGLVQTADGGTLFLDEIGDMPLPLQVKLLRVIQEKQVQKVGSTQRRHVDVRIIAATNQPLSERIEEGKFRKDLYYRINVVEIHLPPLRERGSDISLLTSHFLQKFSQMLGKNVYKLSNEVAALFQKYSWPGNVRELENAIERAVTLCEGSVIHMEDIPQTIVDSLHEESFSNGTLADRVAVFEAHCIRQALDESNYDFNTAAKALGISLATLYRKIKKCDTATGRDIRSTPRNSTREFEDAARLPFS